ncbi:MAG: hypothetical protein ACKVJ5_21180, partial [Pseudoalteromonas sp.]
NNNNNNNNNDNDNNNNNHNIDIDTTLHQQQEINNVKNVYVQQQHDRSTLPTCSVGMCLGSLRGPCAGPVHRAFAQNPMNIDWRWVI